MAEEREGRKVWSCFEKEKGRELGCRFERRGESARGMNGSATSRRHSTVMKICCEREEFSGRKREARDVSFSRRSRRVDASFPQGFAVHAILKESLQEYVEMGVDASRAKITEGGPRRQRNACAAKEGEGKQTSEGRLVGHKASPMCKDRFGTEKESAANEDNKGIEGGGRT